MLYLLIIFFPFAVAAGMFLLRSQPGPSITGAIVCVLTEAILVLQMPVDAPVRLLGLTLTIDPLGQLVLLTILGIALFAYTVTFFITHGEHFIPVSLLLLGFTSTTVLLLQEPFVAALLMVSS